MKYPNIIFFRHRKHNVIDNYIQSNMEKYNCSFNITDSVEDLNKLHNPNYQILITCGPDEKEYLYLSNFLVQRFHERWIHKTEDGVKNIDEFNKTVNFCFIYNTVKKREKTRPIFSIFTTCYKSNKYIDVAYDSIKKQNLSDWEWVIMDDTGTDDHFNFLKDKLSHDNRVRLYRRDKNSGNIGNVKNEANALCRGKYVLEMDHDDEILPDCLKDAYDIFEKDNDIGFVYAEAINLTRNMVNQKYGDFLCFGYGGYYMQKYNNKWVYVYVTPHINNNTLSHLVSCPNHPRIWRRSVLNECENYSEFLPICDDYEILLRTCTKYKVAKNNKFQYIQYINDDGNNFSNIRNHEINRIGPHFISPIYYNENKVQEKMQALDAFDNPEHLHNPVQIWKLDNYTNKRCNYNYNFDYDKQICIINDGIDNEKIKSYYQDTRTDFIYLTNKYTHEELQKQLEERNYDKMKCYNYGDCTEEQLANFFKRLYLNDNCSYEIITSSEESKESE